MKHTPAIALLLLMALFCSARADEGLAPSMNFRNRGGKPIPNVELPAHIPAPRGQLTFYADYLHPDESGLPLYVVNRTETPKSFSSQDNDIYIKLERKTDLGNWERVQSHQSSWCGNSYYNITLAPGSHYKFIGYFPTNGSQSRIRYKCYNGNQLVSNEGIGHYIEDDRLAASVDYIALNELPRSLRSYFHFDISDLEKSNNQRVSEQTLLPALQLVSIFHENSYVRDLMSQYVAYQKTRHAKPSELLGEIQKILAHQWPTTPQPDALSHAAIEVLPNSPILAWKVLNGFVQGRIPTTNEQKSQLEKLIVTEFHKALKRNDPAEITEAAKILNTISFTDEYFDDAFFELWLHSGLTPLTQQCADTLTRRDKIDTLTKAALEMNQAAQIVILKSLASGGKSNVYSSNTIRNPRTSIERRFWLQCAREQPIQTVDALYSMGIQNSKNRFNLSLHDPLVEFLQKEVKSPTINTDSRKLSRVVGFVGAWKREKDAPLFHALLQHPACQSSEGLKSDQPGQLIEFRNYRVRQAAQRALVAMGEYVPADTLLKEEIPIHKGATD